MSRLAEESARLDAANYAVRFTHRCLFSDMDANRHLNNGAIGRLFEEGRTDLSWRVFDPAEATRSGGRLSLLLAAITIEFLAEGRYPGSVEVATAVTRIASSSYVLGQAVYQDGACVALADSVMVKAGAGQPMPLSDAERDLLAGLAFASSSS